MKVRHLPMWRTVLLLLLTVSTGFSAVLIVNGTGAAAYCLSGDTSYAPNGTIQDAIDAASAGDTIIVCKNGTSTYMEDIIINKSISLYGNETGVVVNATTSLTRIFNVSTGPVNISNFTLRDATFVDSSVAGIYSNASNANISNVTIFNNYQGFFLVNSGNNTFIDNTVYNSSYGFYLHENVSNNTFTSNRVSNNTQNGFHIDRGSSNNTFTSNTANNNSRHGFFISDLSSDNVFTSNTVFNNTRGFDTKNTSGNNFSSNTIYNNSEAGIVINLTMVVNRVFSNTIYGHTQGAGVGIFLMDLNNGTLHHIYDNTVENNTYGIYVNQSNLTNNSRNTIRYNTNGIYVSGSSNNSFTSNNVTNNTQYGFVFSEGGDNNLSLNNVTNSSFAQYQLQSRAIVTFTGNNFAYNIPSGVLVFNISGGSRLTTINSYNITTEHLSFSFTNLENLSMVTSFIAGTGVQEDRCGSASYSACRLVSELINFNAIGIGRADSITLFYNTTKTGGGISENEAYIGQWGDVGWSQLGRTGIDTAADSVTYGPLTGFNYVGVVGFAQTSSTSGDSGGSTSSLTISEPELTCPDNTVTFKAMSGSEEVDGVRIRVISDISSISEGEDTTDSNGEATIELTRSGDYHTSTAPASGYASPDEVQFSFTLCGEEEEEAVIEEEAPAAEEEEEVTPPTTTPPASTPSPTAGEEVLEEEPEPEIVTTAPVEGTGAELEERPEEPTAIRLEEIASILLVVLVVLGLLLYYYFRRAK